MKHVVLLNILVFIILNFVLLYVENNVSQKFVQSVSIFLVSEPFLMQFHKSGVDIKRI